ncbi:hypothetical protein FIBSPDRAFT_229608 [Athelia psychrophila]|uniref:Uncharacterized protein n=1 Tax=Athelia psychrophila TaxID=1759441 RepID=A0A165YS44_9AGAM|nr:hypothetical protein FIBSPDRAFT_229608 [Fibularhizoctonia sp. CBS 109695]
MSLSLHTPAMRRLHTLNIAVCNAKHSKLISGDTFSKEVVRGIMRRLHLYRLSIDGKCWEGSWGDMHSSGVVFFISELDGGFLDSPHASR